MNTNPYSRGFSSNGAPRGYGQQRGNSPFLDNPRREGMEREGEPAPMAHERNAPAAPEDPSTPTWQQALIGGMHTPTEFAPVGPPPGTPQRETAYKAPGTAAAPSGPINSTQPVGGGVQFYPTQQVTTQTAAGAPQAGAAPEADQAWRMQIRQQGLANFDQGRDRGWNTSDYGGDQVAATSMKNTFHALATRYPSTPEGLRQLMADPDFKRAFPNATLEQGRNGDVINFGGQLSDYSKGTPVHRVDVGFAFDGANNTGGGWDWMDIDNAGPSAGGMQGAPTVAAPAANNGDLSARLLAALQGGNNSNISVQQLLEQLGLVQPAADSQRTPLF